MSKEKKRTVYRDSKTGKFLSKKDFAKKPKATTEKERVRIGTKKKK